MLRRSTVRHVALAICTLLLAGLLVVVPANPFAPPPAANAASSAAAGDVAFVYQGSLSPSTPWRLAIWHASTNTTDVLKTLSTSDTQVNPAPSPDGSRIAYPSIQGGYGTEIYLINSDGSGETRITTSPLSPNPNTTDWHPSWCSNTSLLFTRTQNNNPLQVFKVNADGTGLAQVSQNNSLNYLDPECSPDGTKIVFNRYNTTTSRSELWYMNVNGSGETKIANQPTSPTSDRDNFAATWSSNNRVYFSSTSGGYGSTVSGINIDGTNLVQSSNVGTPLSPTISADGNTVVYYRVGYLFSHPANGTGTETLIDTGTGYAINPAYFKASYPTAPPSNSTATFLAPSASNAPYTRQFTVTLSPTGNKRYEYGWSTSSTTAPSTTYLQSSTDMTSAPKSVNFLGKYSGTGTTWGGGTQPDQDWYFWVRSVKTNGTANTWGTPLKVHTPKAPVWVGVGDSTSSGHHQDADQPLCVGTCGTVQNDPTFSWITGATDNFNSTLHVPTAWRITPRIVALSGKATIDFGVSGATPGTSSWAASEQAGKLSTELNLRADSWNITSMTGGANDQTGSQLSFATALTVWYPLNPTLVPWNVPTSQPANCPSSELVWQNLQTNGLNATITANLQGIATVAQRMSAGVRIIDVNYPYPVNTGTPTTGNPCYADWTLNGNPRHGAKSVIDALNADHAGVVGSNVKHLDLRSVFGANPTGTGANNTGSLTQLTRLFGYPHWNATGQALVATTAANMAAGVGTTW